MVSLLLLEGHIDLAFVLVSALFQLIHLELQVFLFLFIRYVLVWSCLRGQYCRQVKFNTCEDQLPIGHNLKTQLLL